MPRSPHILVACTDTSLQQHSKLMQQYSKDNKNLKGKQGLYLNPRNSTHFPLKCQAAFTIIADIIGIAVPLPHILITGCKICLCLLTILGSPVLVTVQSEWDFTPNYFHILSVLHGQHALLQLRRFIIQQLSALMPLPHVTHLLGVYAWCESHWRRP